MLCNALPNAHAHWQSRTQLQMTGLKPASLVEEGEQEMRLRTQNQATHPPPFELSDAARYPVESCSSWALVFNLAGCACETKVATPCITAGAT